MSSVDRIKVKGLPAVRLTTADGASAVVTEHGAHTLSWVPAGSKERLYLSERSSFEPGKAIRGGVPVIFPQFSTFGVGRRHGFARLAQWTVSGESIGDSEVSVDFSLVDSKLTFAEWACSFALRLTITLTATQLELQLHVRNPGDRPFMYTAALHTYLKVANISDVRVTNLCGLRFLDQTSGGRQCVDTNDPLIVSGETDRIYFAPNGAVTLQEREQNLHVSMVNFSEFVLWNPWQAKCATLGDMEPHDFLRMICIEAALIAQPVELRSGDEWWGRQTLVAVD